MDETSVSCEFGKLMKVYVSSETHYGGCVTSSIGSGSGTHVTAVIAVSASGRKPPPFFIVQGKKVMSAWFDPLPKESYGGHILTGQDWFPADGAVEMSEKWSMTREKIPSFVKHLDKYVRNILPSSTSYLLTLDGHKSRMGVEWLELCQQNNCEGVEPLAYTSHFLQPCDQFVNKAF